jgi:lipopolysaccharide assembly outer membrane protein LptD (OstA)
MKRAVLLLFFASFVALAVGQNGGVLKVSLTAKTVQREGSLIQYRGDVEMATDSFVLRADEVDFQPDSGMAEARGNVRVQILHLTSSTPTPKMQHP